MKQKLKRLIKHITSKFNIVLKKNIDGKKFRVPILGNLGFQNMRQTELWMTDLLNTILPLNSGKFIDVGINIGQTLLKLRSQNKEIQYLGFEPNPSCIYYVSKLIEVNSFNNTMVFPVGVSTKTRVGELHFYDDTDDDSSASILPSFRVNKVIRKAHVPLFNIDTLKNTIEFGNIGILKVDVEGAELEVLQSFKDIIKTNKPFIILEILPVYNKLDNPIRFETQKKIETSLLDLGYQFFRILKKNGRLKGLHKTHEIGIHSDLSACDYLVIHRSKLESFFSNTNVIIEGT